MTKTLVTLVTLVETTGRQRSIRWALQVALLAGGLGEPAFWFLLSVVPLAFECPLRTLSSGRGRFAVLAARVVGAATVVVGPSAVSVEITSLLTAATESLLVFVAAYALSRATSVRGRVAR